MPALGAERYLIDALLEAGPAGHDPMAGQRPLSWVELDAWARLTGAISEPWEARWLYEASGAYCEEVERGKNPLTIAPVDRGKPVDLDD